MKYWKDIEEFQIKKKVTSKNYDKSGRGAKKLPWEYESDIIINFDLESTSAFINEKGEMEKYIKGKSEVYWNKKTPVSCPYIWMISIEDEVYYGRYLEEVVDFLKLLPKDVHFIIFVHNLAFDFYFLQNVLKFENVFGREQKHPIKASCVDFPNIEFRCSYTLTGLSLEAWGKKIGLPKAVGDLEYNEIRTPLTQLTERELFYCERDVVVMYKGISQYLKKYGHLKDIPLTQTGEVRRVVKSRMLANKNLQNKLIKLIPKTAHMYDAMKKTFAGGYTHANYLYSGTVLDVGGSHYDFASSYPAVMCSEKFPMTPFEKDFFNKDEIEEKAFLMRVRYEQLRPKTYNHFISESKCLRKSDDFHFVVDNGRVISADYIEIWVTEQDYITIKESYKYSKMKVLECYSSKKDYLPKEFVSYVLELYANKTMYKDVDGMEEIYNQSKQFINSLFGMCVTDFIYDEVSYDNGEWSTNEKTVEDVEDYLKELQTKNQNRTFVAYQWGVWITAYARRNLWKCILSCDKEVVYCDTDSIFLIGDKDFSWYNKEVTDKLRKCCEYHKIDFELTRPKTPKGKEKPLGIFDREEDWDEFITLGAKRYCYRSSEDKELHLTVSGINKAAVKVLNDDIRNFNEDLVFDKDADGVSKKLRIYIDDMDTVMWGDGYVSNYKYGIALRPTSYSMSITDQYLELLSSILTLKNYLNCIG